jgi:DNA-binding transcriptional LysR family regulator
MQKCKGRQMDAHWDDLKIFLAVARNESLSRAGRVLKIDPATVGRRVARLEDEVNVPLFAKSPTGYALTDAGQRLMGHAERMEQAMIEATEEMAGKTGGLTGQIRIGAPDGRHHPCRPRRYPDRSEPASGRPHGPWPQEKTRRPAGRDARVPEISDACD